MEDVDLPTNPAVAPRRDATAMISQESLLKSINKAPTHSAPRIDGMRYEHVKVMAQPQVGLAAILSLARQIARGDVPSEVADLLATSRIMAFPKDTPDATNVARESASASNVPFVPAVRPIGVGLVMTRITTAALLETHMDAITAAILPDFQHGFRNKSGAEVIRLAIRIGLRVSN